VFSVSLEPVAENVVIVRCTFPHDATETFADTTLLDFQRELNDQVLRERVRPFCESTR
jgi:hypothetical protein